VGVAYIVAEPGTTPDPEEVIVWARRSMSNYKVPRTVTVLDVLPTNANGKVDKLLLAEMARTQE